MGPLPHLSAMEGGLLTFAAPDPHHIPYDQAVATYLEHYRARFSNAETWRTVRRVLRRFGRHAGVEYANDLTSAHVANFLFRFPYRDYYIRKFIEWLNPKIGAAIYIPPRKDKVERKWVAFPVANRDRQRLHKWQQTASACAPLMYHPHQRLIYLLGYRFGLGLAKQVQMTAQEIAELGLAAEIAHYFDKVSPLFPSGEPALRPWLGLTRSTAHKTWKKWVGSGRPFPHIVYAGAKEIMDRNGRPVGLTTQTLKVLLSCYEKVDERLLEALPGVWRKVGA